MNGANDNSQVQKRPYTSNLGVPEQCPRPAQLDSSVISDAGDQLHKIQRRSHADDFEILQGEHTPRFRERLSSITQEYRHDFQENLVAALVDTQNPGLPRSEKGFLPKGQLDLLINKETVFWELLKNLSSTHRPHHVAELAETVCDEIEVLHNGKHKLKSFKKIFALLVITDRTSSISLFIDEDVSDLDLPLAAYKVKGKKAIELRRRNSSDEPYDKSLECFSHQLWSPIKLQTFEDYQWTMLAPFFYKGIDGDVKHYRLKDQCILPFVRKEEDIEDDGDECRGGFGRVFMVRIHKEHHNFDDQQSRNDGFAIKQLYEQNGKMFTKEVNILKKFSGERRHPHVVSLLATYEHCKRFHMIFDRAQGDVFKYWKDIVPTPPRDYTSVCWFAEQCAGIAHGLLKLHRHLTTIAKTQTETQDEPEQHDTRDRRVRLDDNIRTIQDEQPLNDSLESLVKQPQFESEDDFHERDHRHTERFGRHGDINPANILWYDRTDSNNGELKGILKLADFGQAEINSRLTKSKKGSVANTLTYRPPECDLQPKIIRQSYDIWCLGCVYLEFTTWMLGGWPLVMEFAKLRKAYDVFLHHDSDTFFRVVSRTHTHHVGVEVKQAVTEFINRLHQHPKCTEYFHVFLDMIENNMLAVDSINRQSCETTWKHLKDMYEKCRIDLFYAIEKNPWCRSRLQAVSTSVAMPLSPEAESCIGKTLLLPPILPEQAVLVEFVVPMTIASKCRSLAFIESLCGSILSLWLSGSVLRLFIMTFRASGTRADWVEKQNQDHSLPQKCRSSTIASKHLHEDEDDDISPREPTRETTLGSELLTSFVESTFDARKQAYLPEGVLKYLVKPKSIREELELDRLDPTIQFSKEKQDALVHWIVSEAPKIFAITFECDIHPRRNMLSALVRFKKCRFNDEKLGNGIKTSSGFLRPSPDPIFREDVWTQWKLNVFHEKQWRYLVPLFTKAGYSYDIDADCILPFEKAGEAPKEGAFGFVYKVKIHPSHQEHHQHHWVAIKEIRVTRGDDKQGTNEAWEREARALQAINKLDHEHVIKCFAAIRRGDSRYFMFPWADGDSLRDYWTKVPKQTPNASLIEQAIAQIRGIADALDKLHNFESDASIDPEDRFEEPADEGEIRVQNEAGDYVDIEQKQSIRHGDLKPENILRFTNSPSGLGQLKIADMGLAKRHVVATQYRTHNTSTKYSTTLYEAPETKDSTEARSRLFDIWSMGCITFEYIIWLLYGNDELMNFYKQLKGDGRKSFQYFEDAPPSEPNKSVVHYVVSRWMDHILATDPECSQDSAIRDLLQLVRDELLVVPLPPGRSSSFKSGPRFAPPAPGESITRYRATASKFRDALDNIITKTKSAPRYLLTGKERKMVKAPKFELETFLPVPVPSKAGPRGDAAGEDLAKPLQSLSLTGITNRNLRDYSMLDLKDWEIIVDNDFASEVAAKVGYQNMKPRISLPTQLCDRCTNLDFWIGGFSFQDRLVDLATRAPQCDFCNILHSICKKPEVAKIPLLRFDLSKSNLMIASGGPLPILSIIRSPELRTLAEIQLGFPELPEPGSNVFFQIIRSWLDDCDTHHDDCRRFTQVHLPTRLINVGSAEEPRLCLLETRQTKVDDDRYVALSHPWGDKSKHPPFCTLRKDDSGHGHTLDSFKVEIPFEQLPATFKDAILTTRALNIRYLWIDSICIVQGKDGDFNEEAKRMEDVFSGAHCVIAASRANGQTDGFLGARQQRDYLTFQRGNEAPFYVCQPLDDFGQDVLEGALNRRGWVLQERALARRTVFFTERQTYFECGGGVRCETLGRMHNNMADFLGDPKFPAKAMTRSRGLKISYFKDLYQQYSRLQFSSIEDRPVAIAGLENRLKRAFRAEDGRYGIFDDGPGGGLFHRSLLWRRGEDEETLVPIVFSADRNNNVPTWSWMAYRGGINYLDPEFETADWERNEIRPAWTSNAGWNTIKSEQSLGTALIATVRDFNVANRHKTDIVQIVYDTDRRASNGSQPQCVILAKTKKEGQPPDKTYFVLIVAPTHSGTAYGEKVYHRVGAGKMLGKYIYLGGEGTQAIIY
ncbi:hypothetical protein BDV96DRAFT_483175 [Lophiotrema nucula]|uniref:Protein kinase domain-containing protein n=1 Tax=Lophiotrema nucula TaxID=690887 RepID=A0A6A5ZTS1_9PLEO|nr:hypothetical protein BDV96DRAFT_483175 [Lophiotrema nucula]